VNHTSHAKSITRSLVEAGCPPSSLVFADGTLLLLLPHGGRVLGLFAPSQAENFFWTNPDLESREATSKLLSSDRWQNTGGERTWLAPEVDFFFPNYPDLTSYRPPAGLDPGSFRLLLNGTTATLETEIQLESFRQMTRGKLRISKTLSSAPNPLGAMAGPLSAVHYAGYTTHTTLRSSTGKAAPFAAALWSLIQLPHGGEMIIPTYGRAKPVLFFGNLLDGDLRIKPGLVRYRMRSPGEHKISIKSVSCTGRSAYAYLTNDEANLVVQNYQVNPSGNYIDVPKDQLGDTDHCFQACNVSNPTLGSFSELEHHTPALAGRDEGLLSEDLSQVWAFRGSPEAIANVGSILLGLAANEPLFPP